MKIGTFWCWLWGHKWVPVFTKKYNNWLICCYCERCRKGYQDICNYVGKNCQIDTYNEEIYRQEIKREELK